MKIYVLTLNGTDWVSPSILLTRVVKHGDSLPSILFNIAIDHLFRSLSSECRLRFCGGIIKSMGFAEDMNQILETPQGLQSLIDHSKAYLLQCGIKINQAKSHKVSIVRLGKKKKAVVYARRTFTIDGMPV